MLIGCEDECLNEGKGKWLSRMLKDQIGGLVEKWQGKMLEFQVRCLVEPMVLILLDIWMIEICLVVMCLNV